MFQFHDSMGDFREMAETGGHFGLSEKVSSF